MSNWGRIAEIGIIGGVLIFLLKPLGDFVNALGGIGGGSSTTTGGSPITGPTTPGPGPTAPFPFITPGGGLTGIGEGLANVGIGAGILGGLYSVGRYILPPLAQRIGAKLGPSVAARIVGTEAAEGFAEGLAPEFLGGPLIPGPNVFMTDRTKRKLEIDAGVRPGTLDYHPPSILDLIPKTATRPIAFAHNHHTAPLGVAHLTTTFTGAHRGPRR